MGEGRKTAFGCGCCFLMSNRKIALTGGIATGKSTVARRLKELGATVLDADEYARRVVEPETPSWKALKDLIGPAFFDHEGRLRRRELRERIIQDPSLREKLDAVLHPFILRAMWEEWEKIRRLHPQTVVIFDIPLLFEGGFDKDFDLILLAYAAPEVQVRRLAERDKISLPEAERTLAMQYPIDSKKDLAHYIIDNGGSLEQTMRQIDDLWEKISREE